MISIRKRPGLVVCALLLAVTMVQAQTKQQKEALSVQGYSAPVAVLESHGRTFVDVQELARVTGGSVSFEKDRIILVLPRTDASAPGDDAPSTRFSPAFQSSAIEAMASIREWGGMLMAIVRNGYPVGNNMAGNTLEAFEARSADAVALASAAASTDADRQGLELLKYEYSNVQQWSDSYVQARITLSAANLSTSEHAIEKDEGAQKALQCGRFLSQMFASGAVEENLGCR